MISSKQFPGANAAADETREYLFKNLLKNSRNAEILARFQEIVFWSGSTIAAVCSAVAGISIATDSSILGKFVTGALAIFPAVWAAIDRSLRLRQLSAHNHHFAAQYQALLLNALAQKAGPETQATVTQWADIVLEQNRALASLLLTNDVSIRNPLERDQAARERATQRETLQAARGEVKPGAERDPDRT